MKPLPKPASRMPRMVMRQKPMRFPFAWSARRSRKTAQCCLEKNCVRAIERRTTVNSLPEGSHANHEKLYESEKRTELIQTTFKLIRFTGQCALGDIDFFCSLPRGFSKQKHGTYLLVQFLRHRHSVHCWMRAHSSVRARRFLFGPGISPCLSETTMHVLSVPHPPKVYKESRAC